MYLTSCEQCAQSPIMTGGCWPAAPFSNSYNSMARLLFVFPNADP